MLGRNILRRPLYLSLSLSLLTSSYANEAPLWDEPSFPIELAMRIVKLTPTVVSEEGAEIKLLECNTAFNLRLTSHFWKKVADDVFIREKIYTIILKPSNYGYPVVKTISPLGTSILLEGWDKSNSDQLSAALTISTFPHVENITCRCNNGLAYDPITSIGEEGAIHIAAGLQAAGHQKFPKLKKLYIVQGFFGERGGRALGQALQYLPELSTIALNGQMGPQGTMKFAKGLKYTQKLEDLLLDGNGVGNGGCIAIARKFKYLPHLTTLSLSTVYQDAPGGNSRFIGEGGARCIARKLNKHYHNKLPGLSIMGHDIGEQGRVVLLSVFGNDLSKIMMEETS